MKMFATVNPSEAMRLTPLLKAAGIPCAAGIVTEETGLWAVELSTEESSFEAACGVAEAWFEAETNETAISSASHSCPDCHSTNLKVVDHETAAFVIHCADCGYSIAF